MTPLNLRCPTKLIWSMVLMLAGIEIGANVWIEIGERFRLKHLIRLRAVANFISISEKSSYFH